MPLINEFHIYLNDFSGYFNGGYKISLVNWKRNILSSQGTSANSHWLSTLF